MAAGGTFVFDADDNGSAAVAKKAPPATTAITRGDLVDTISVDGTLTYAAERVITGWASGTLTSIPAPGKVIRQGDALYEVDRRPVALMYGTLPLYRTLEPGVTNGPDVDQLENALKALGYGADLTVDQHFSAATALAVRRWQKDNGLESSGSINAAEVVFLPSAIRVIATKATVGDRVGSGRQILAVTSTHRAVHVDLDVDDQNLAKKGLRVSVQLPGGVSTGGTITSVGTVAKKKKSGSADSADPGQSRAATIDVDIELNNAKISALDQAPVTVTMESRRRKDVLSVPVEALLALREGGYGLEVIEPDGAQRIVAVMTGAYGSGRVEISGPGLAAGVKVGVAAQ